MFITVALLGATGGCVASSTFEQAQQKSYAQHQEDQRQLLELTTSNKRLKQRIEELEGSLAASREQLARVEREWKEARDELLKLKIEKEQSSAGKRRDRAGQERPTDTSDELRLRERLEEAKRRLKEVLQQLQGALE